MIDLGVEPGVYENIVTGLTGDPGSTGSWRVANSRIAGTFVYDGAGNIDLNVTSVGAGGLEITQAVSRASHGNAGSFNIRLPLVGTPAVECRDSGGVFDLVFTFNSSIVSGNAAVVAGIGAVDGVPIFSGNTMIVRLTGVANAQRLTVSLNDVTNAASDVLPPTEVTLGFLVGDVNGSGVVNATDVAQTKAASGQLVSPANFRADINASGTLTAADIGQAKTNAGMSLP